MSKFETTLEDEIVCPYCGFRQSDSWEWGEEDDEFECGECGQVSVLNVYIETSYTTMTKEAWLQEKADIAGRLADDNTGEDREYWLAKRESRLAQIKELQEAGR